MRRIFPAVIFVALLFTTAPAQVAEPDPYDGDLADWSRGPVRYIITPAEDTYYRQLASDEERTHFIERFWARRNPNPHGTENPYRYTFWARVLEANRRFTESAYPGWKTDRGKIFILLGEPDDIREYSEFDTKDAQRATRGLIRWSYLNLPLSRSLDPETIVAFVRDNTGDYRLSTDPKFNDLYFDPLRSYGGDAYGDLASLQHNLPLVARSELGTALDLGRLQKIPSEEQAIHDIVLTREFFSTLPVQVLAHRFPAREPGSLVSLTVLVPAKDLDPPFRGDPQDLQERFRLVARLTGIEGTGYVFGEADFQADPRPDPADPMLRWQARRVVPPGTYRLALAVFDLRSNRAATVRRDEVIPAFPPEGPALSDLVHASRLRPIAGPEHQGFLEPFILGDLEVVPRGPRPLSRRDRLRIYFLVLPPPGPAEPVPLEYRFLHQASEDAAFEPVAPPGRLPDATGAQTWDLSLEAFPPGRYRVTVEAVASGTLTRRSLEFVVED